MSGRVAFVHYPHFPDQARLETMPFALQTVFALARAGWWVDVYLWQRDVAALTETCHDKIRYRCPGPAELALPKRAQAALHALRDGLPGGYECVFGLGQIGLHVASAMARVARCPLVYLNDELPSGCPETVWTRLERKAGRRADFVLSPDSRRNPQLLSELGLVPDKPSGVLYNRPVIEYPLPHIDWHSRFGMPAHKHIVLHAGSVADWAEVPEVLATVPTWPEDTVLLIHSRGSDALAKYRRSLEHLQADGRVYWSDAPLAEPELHSLIAASAACLGLYRNIGPNIELVGFSSGKILRSLACGTPVIASSFDSLSFVRDHDLGVQVTHPLEIAECLPNLIQDRAAYRERCVAFVSKEIDFDIAWRTFCAAFLEAAGLNLARPARRA